MGTWQWTSQLCYRVEYSLQRMFSLKMSQITRYKDWKDSNQVTCLEFTFHKFSQCSQAVSGLVGTQDCTQLIICLICMETSCQTIFASFPPNIFCLIEKVFSYMSPAMLPILMATQVHFRGLALYSVLFLWLLWNDIQNVSSVSSQVAT